MTLKEKIQRKIDMVEYYRETNCDKQQFSEKFKVSGDNFFYSVKVIAGNEKKFKELKEKLKEPRKPYHKWKKQYNSNEIEEWLVNGIKEMISRGKTNKEISRIFNRKEDEIERYVGDLSV